MIKHKEDHLVDVQKLKTEMEYILAQEIKKREESQRRVQQEVERLQEELKHMVAKQDERNQLLMQVDRTLNETLPDKVTGEESITLIGTTRVQSRQRVCHISGQTTGKNVTHH